jgi:hypothetical protein
MSPKEFAKKAATYLHPLLDEMTVDGTSIMGEHGDTLFAITITKIADISYEEDEE